MEGEQGKPERPNAEKSGITFHSGDISRTKAKEKREIFTKVEEKKTLKQSAEEFQKKFAEAKTQAAESRARIENPGADESGMIRSHKRFNINWKLVRRIAIPVVIGAGLAAAVYFNWGAINHEFFEVSESRAQEFLPDNPDRFIGMYDELISNAESTDEKVELLFKRIAMLDSSYGGQYTTQMLTDAYKAYEILPCYETGAQIVESENKYGSTDKASEWTVKLDSLEKEGLILGNG